MKSHRQGGRRPAARDGVRTPAPDVRTDLPLDVHERYFHRGQAGDVNLAGTRVHASEWPAWTDAPFERACLALSATEGGADAS